MENESFKIVEINGVKVWVDLRQCKVIEEYKVGDPVKVLIKKYSDTYESHAGVIIGFDDFKVLPTIVIAYLEASYSSAEIKWVYFNSKSQDIEICPLNTLDKFIDKSHALNLLDNNIEKKKLELEELQGKKKYFEKEFACYFGDIKI